MSKTVTLSKTDMLDLAAAIDHILCSTPRPEAVVGWADLARRVGIDEALAQAGRYVALVQAFEAATPTEQNYRDAAARLFETHELNIGGFCCEDNPNAEARISESEDGAEECGAWVQAWVFVPIAEARIGG